MSKDKILGAFLGMRIGDVLGAPHEGSGADDIRHRMGANVRNPILTFARNSHSHPDPKRWDKFSWTGTDDTQLTHVVAKSLIEAHGFNARHQAESHVAAAQVSTEGWGKAQVSGARELGAFFRDSERGRSFDVWPTAKPDEGLGNGVAMKVMPLALWATA